MSTQETAEIYGTEASDLTLQDSLIEFEHLSEEEQDKILISRM